MARRSRPKAKMQAQHARTRGAERYGLSLSKDDLAGMVRQIQGGWAEFVGRDSLRVSVYIVRHSGRHLPAVYDKDRHTIVTLLPLDADCMEPYRSEWMGPQGAGAVGDYCEGAGE